MGPLSALAGFFLVSVGEGALGSGTYDGRGAESLSPDGTAGGKCFPGDWIMGAIRAEPKVGIGAVTTYHDLELRAGNLTEAAADAGEVFNRVYIYEDPMEDRPVVFLEIKLTRLCMGAEWGVDEPGMGHAYAKMLNLVNTREHRPPDWVLNTTLPAFPGLQLLPKTQPRTKDTEGHADHISGFPSRPVVLPGSASADGSSNVRQRFFFGQAGLWRMNLPAVVLILHLLAFLYVARKPLRYGDHEVAGEETMTYGERFLAVSTLYLLSGGASIVFLIIEGYLLFWVWRFWGTSWGFVPAAFFFFITYVVMRPLPYRFPDHKALRHPLFALWRKYFRLEHFVQEEDELARLMADRGKTFLLAQLPHGIMPFGALFGHSIADQVFAGMSPVSGVVATMLLRTPIMRHLVNWLGVREAGRASIVQMFADGYRASVLWLVASRRCSSRKRLRISSPPRGALQRSPCSTGSFDVAQGGHVVLPVFVFGVSRTHVLAPGCKKLQGLSRKFKVPLVLFHGAFSLVPYRQKLKLVVSRALIVEKVAKPTDAQIDDVIREINTRIEDIYNDASIRPAWETRPLRFSK